MFHALRLYLYAIIAINSWPETRNHLLASLLLSAGRRDAGCRRAGESASGRKKRAVLCTSYSTPVLLPDRRCAGRTDGRRTAIQVHNGVALYDGTHSAETSCADRARPPWNQVAQ
jgi:hypothetical protein